MQLGIDPPGCVEFHGYHWVLSPFERLEMFTIVVANTWAFACIAPSIGRSNGFQVASDMSISPYMDDLVVQAVRSLANACILKTAPIWYIKIVVQRMVFLDLIKHAIEIKWKHGLVFGFLDPSAIEFMGIDRCAERQPCCICFTQRSSYMNTISGFKIDGLVGVSRWL